MPSTLDCISTLALTLWLFPHAAQGSAKLPSFMGCKQSRSDKVQGIRCGRSQSTSKSMSRETAMGH